MVRDEQTFDADDLETALDFAALWSICPEASLPFVRSQLAGVVGQKAEWSYQLRGQRRGAASDGPCASDR